MYTILTCYCANTLEVNMSYKSSLSIALLFVCVLLICQISNANELTHIPSSINTAEKFSKWLTENFSYQWEISNTWQNPTETMTKRTGDCEDFSILLCSLLRSNGWATDSVYVVVGERNDMYHAWVRLVWNDMQYNIEPQGSGFDVLIGDITNLSGFEAICYFNDQKFGSF